MLVGLQAAAEEALREPEDDEFRETGGCPTEERADREHGDADQEIAFAAEHLAKPTGDRQHDAVGDEVGRQYPGGIIVRHCEVAGDITQCDVDDRGVENFHERRERDNDGNEPRVMARSPGRVGGGRRRANVGHRTVTVGSTEILNGIVRSRGRPLSRRFLLSQPCIWEAVSSPL